MSDTVDREEIVGALVDGASVAVVSRRFSLSESEVRLILDEETRRWYDATELRQRWMLAERRMLSLELQFFKLAKEKDDHIAGALAVKANERRSVLSGANAPQGYVVHMTNAAPLIQETSTEYYRRVLDRLMGLPEAEPEGPPGPQH
jgi:hypothetical protein